MSSTSNDVEWVETTEEVVITDDGPSSENNLAATPDLESVKTPIQKLLDSVGQVENVEADGGFYCEECLGLFQNQSTSADITGPSFILDFPTSLGIPQRALLTLPHGLVIGRSSIPNAGIGVLNNGPVVSPGMHFGPYEGEVTEKENALASHFSWEIYKGGDTYEYIDGVRESHSNWMRYVACARNKDESNLSAVEYNRIILFHCSRTINPGDELLVWPSSKLLAHFTDVWSQVWFSRANGTGSNSTPTSPAFLCPQEDCQLAFTTEAFLQRHTESLHPQINLDSSAAPTDAAQVTGGDSANSLVVLTIDTAGANTCGDCGKFFKQIPHLRRHKLCVHSNKRPYCCLQCRRSFSQASGLIRHQMVHRKQAAIKDTDVAIQDAGTNEEDGVILRTESEDATTPEEMKEAGENKSVLEDVRVTCTVSSSAAEAALTWFDCSDCGKTFSRSASLRRHKAAVHERLRPYACAVCRKCFRQHSDLMRHLQHHQKQSQEGEEVEPAPGNTSSTPLGCEDCSLAFPSEEDLQQHLNELHSEAVEPQDDVSSDPDFKVKPSAAKSNESFQREPTQRPQRLGAQSRISAITKLIAPRRRAVVCKKAGAPAETEPTESDASTPRRWFGCNRCHRTCADPAELEAHRCILRRHKCGQCGATFVKSALLKRHQQAAHKDLKNINCERCGKAFMTPGSLRQHQKSNTCVKYHCASELFSCTFCQFSFTMKSYLVKHIKRHHPAEYVPRSESDGVEEEKEEGRHVCPHCSQSCASAKEFKAHSCFQQVKVLYLCTDCGKGFTNHYGLKQHQRVHTGEKPYTCPHCSKSFSYNGQLTVHLRTHTGEKPYLCTHCGESFRQSGDLKRHERKHTGVRPYSCAECCKSFSRPQSLKAHQMLHLGQKMFKCTQCGKSFSRSYHLRRHHQKMHS